MFRHSCLAALTLLATLLAPVAMAAQESYVSLARPLFVAAGAPTIAEGPVARGGDLVSVPVNFGVTGVLTRPAEPYNTNSPALPAGQPMFGMTFSDRLAGPQRVWCTLRPDPLGRREKNGQLKWESVCLPFDARMRRHIWRAQTIVLVSPILNWSPAAPGAREVVVEEKPARLGVPVVLTYRLLEFDKKDADINLYLSVDGYETQVDQIRVVRAADGSVTLPIMGGALRLTQHGSDRRSAVVEVLRPPAAGNVDLPLH